MLSGHAPLTMLTLDPFGKFEDINSAAGASLWCSIRAVVEGMAEGVLSS